MTPVPLATLLLAGASLALAAWPPQLEGKRRHRLLGVGARPGEGHGPFYNLKTALRRSSASISSAAPGAFQGGPASGSLVAAASCMALAVALVASGRSAAALGVGLAGFAVLGAPPAMRMANARAERRRIEGELPLAVEKLAVYLASGYSLSAALARLGEQVGASAPVFSLMSNGVRSGMSAADAAVEAARRWPGPAMARLAALLEGGAGGADMVKAARSTAAGLRAEAHRDALAAMEKDSQKIWIPITIAALVPGVVMIFVPFVAVLRTVAG